MFCSKIYRCLKRMCPFLSCLKNRMKVTGVWFPCGWDKAPESFSAERQMSGDWNHLTFHAQRCLPSEASSIAWMSVLLALAFIWLEHVMTSSLPRSHLVVGNTNTSLSTGTPSRWLQELPTGPPEGEWGPVCRGTMLAGGTSLLGSAA